LEASCIPCKQGIPTPEGVLDSNLLEGNPSCWNGIELSSLAISAPVRKKKSLNTSHS
jgi:hypothetical protein